MEFVETKLAGCFLIKPRVHRDERGFFLETFRASALEAAGIEVDLVQGNHSRSQRGTLRGLHFQMEHTQGKLVRVTSGEVFDVAVDLRQIVGVMRIATDLERIGDLAKNNAKRVMQLDSDFNPMQLIRGLEHMSDLVATQLKSVLDAFAAHDVPAAMEVWKGDEEVDAICTSLFRELLTYMLEDPRNISYCIHLMFCAKNIERIGDHATNVAETVVYMVEGQPILDPRPKADQTAFAVAPGK